MDGSENGGRQRRLISQKEAADYLSVSYDTVRRLNFRGEIRYLRIGRRILIDVADLEAYIERAKIQHGA